MAQRLVRPVRDVDRRRLEDEFHRRLIQQRALSELQGGFIDFRKLGRDVTRDVNKGFQRAVDKVSDTVEDVKKSLVDLANFNRLTKSAQATLDKYGDKMISSIKVYRTALPKGINVLADIVSKGKWGVELGKTPYDELFHLGLIITLQGGREILVEKNEVIYITDGKPFIDKTSSFMDAPYNGNQTLAELLDKTRKQMGTQRFFNYDPFRNNCQMFTWAVLKAANAQNNELHEFVLQDLKQFAKGLSKKTRDTAAIVPQIRRAITKLQGGRKRKRRRN